MPTVKTVNNYEIAFVAAVIFFILSIVIIPIGSVSNAISFFSCRELKASLGSPLCIREIEPREVFNFTIIIFHITIFGCDTANVKSLANRISLNRSIKKDRELKVEVVSGGKGLFSKSITDFFGLIESVVSGVSNSIKRCYRLF